MQCAKTSVLWLLLLIVGGTTTPAWGQSAPIYSALPDLGNPQFQYYGGQLGREVLDELHGVGSDKLRQIVFQYNDPDLAGLPFEADVRVYGNPEGGDYDFPLLAGPFTVTGLPRGRANAVVDVIIPDSAVVGPDLWIGVQFTSPTAGLVIAETADLGFSHDVYVENGGFYFFGGNPRANFAFEVSVDVTPLSWSQVTPLAFNLPLDGVGVAWGDVDNDGDEDLYLSSGPGEANRLVLNQGGGSFADALEVCWPNDTPTTFSAGGAAWADVDNDYDLDLYLGNLDGDNVLFTGDKGTAVDCATDATMAGTASDVTQAVAWADYDQDGLVDVFLANLGGANKLVRNLGGGSFQVATPPAFAGVEDSYGAAWGDADGDGDQDLCVANFNGQPNRLFRNDGGGNFTDVTPPALQQVSHSTGCAWADYDGDGDLDLYVVNGKAGEVSGNENQLLRNVGAFTFTEIVGRPVNHAGIGRGCAWFDGDLDGDLDLYLNNEGANVYLENRGGGFLVENTSSAVDDATDGRGLAAADYDGDGDIDLAVVGGNGGNPLYSNELPSTNHWLQLRLKGGPSNRSAIGAHVTVYAGGSGQLRAVEGGSGFLSQNSLALEFGLGAATAVDSVVIRWPGPGAPTQILYGGVDVDRAYQIVEGRIATAAPASVPTLSRLMGNRPNPFNPRTEIEFEIAQPGAVTLAIYDARGRRVRTLADGTAYVPGPHRLLWDGRSDDGSRLASGVYHVRLVTAQVVSTRPLVLLK